MAAPLINAHIERNVKPLMVQLARGLAEYHKGLTVGQEQDYNESDAANKAMLFQLEHVSGVYGLLVGMGDKPDEAWEYSRKALDKLQRTRFGAEFVATPRGTAVFDGLRKQLSDDGFNASWQ